MTRPIINKTHIQTEVAPYYYLILYSSSPLSLLLPLFYINIHNYINVIFFLKIKYGSAIN